MASRIRRRRRRQVHHVWRKVLIVIGVLVVAAGVAGGIGAAWALNIWNEAPDLSSLKPVQKGRSSAIYAADGSLIGYIQSDNIRQPVAADQLPEDLKNATVSIEDKGFWQHGALDPQGIARAAWKDLLAGGKPVQGASTITQQLVRNLYIQNPEDTIHRKIIEAHLAEDLFEAHDREWILTQYLNTAPYGTNGGQTAVGAEAASQTYFDKPVKDLGLTEAALLAGLPQAPSEYNPFLYPKAALQRRNEVLGTMVEQGYISRDEYHKAKTGGLGLEAGHKYTTVKDQFLFDLVESELIERYGINTVRNGGLKAYTTIDPAREADAEAAIAESCSACAYGPKAGLASVNPKNGAIVALASSPPEEGEEEFNYSWQAERQPGSSFKTFVLTTAIKQGIDPETTYYDGTSPITLAIPGGGYWNVHNAEESGGVMSLKTATTDSTNVVFAQLDLDVGPENVTQTAEEMGIEAELLSVPAEAIGGLTYGVSPLEMADGYATLASGGIHHDPTAISKVEFPDGKVDDLLSENGERVLTEGQAYEVTKILETVITEGTGSPYTYMGCTSEAGKTGTSEEESDAWFVGYTPMYSTAVWVGHPTTREYTGFGGPTAGPVWQNYMSAAQGGDCPEFEEPSELPELHSYSSEHTRSSSEVGSGDEEFEESEAEEKKHQKEEEKEEGGEEEDEGAEEPAEEAAPPPPSPEPHVGGGVSPG
jgi:penicillin-binding protein 1A